MFKDTIYLKNLLTDIFLIIVILFLCILDQFVKIWIHSNIKLESSKVIIRGFFNLTNIINFGAAWSTFNYQHYLLIFVSLLIIVGLIFVIFFYKYNFCYKLGYSLILSGAFGNLIDRILHGYVIDMFEVIFLNFPVFNLADFLITLGVIVLLVTYFIDETISYPNRTK